MTLSTIDITGSPFTWPPVAIIQPGLATATAGPTLVLEIMESGEKRTIFFYSLYMHHENELFIQHLKS